MTIADGIAIGSVAATGVVWLAVLHARISLAKRDATDARKALRSHEDLCSERYANIERQHEETRSWMERLEGKIDILMTKL